MLGAAERFAAAWARADYTAMHAELSPAARKASTAAIAAASASAIFTVTAA